MKIPALKRIKVTSRTDLTTWLARHDDQAESVMLVTQTDPASPKHVSRETVAEALAAHGWVAGPRFTLNDTLIGHVVSRRPPGDSQ